MLDNYERDINYLRVSITDRCNLRCTYCRPKEGVSLKGHYDILRYEEITRIVSRAVKMGLIKVRLTGGEPLVRRGFVSFAASLRRIDGLEDITLTTNGILLAPFAKRIFKAGINRINISLDSLNAEKYSQITRGGRLDDVLKGIAEAEAVGFSPIKINVVVMKGFNDDEILDFAKLAVEKPFQVRFIEVMPVSDANPHQLRDFLSSEDLYKTISGHLSLEAQNGKKSKSDGPAKIYKVKNGLGEIGLINPVSNHFCSTCNRLRLTADGKLRACLLKDEEIDLKAALHKGCSDEDLDALIREAVLIKPRQHDLDCTDRHFKKCHRNMSDIGG